MKSKEVIKSIRFENLSYRYENQQDWLFKDLSFELPMGRFVKIESHGGSGKSTLLRLMAALLDPASGSLFINEQNISEMSFEEFTPLRLQIGYSFDLGGLLNNRSLKENIALPLMYHNICSADEGKNRVEHMLKVFELESVANQRPSAVRGSDRKSTILARSLIMNPQVLLLDDPTTGLSLGVTERFIAEIQRQQKEQLHSVFVASEDQKLLSEFDVHRILIHEKQLIEPEALSSTGSRSEAA